MQRTSLVLPLLLAAPLVAPAPAAAQCDLAPLEATFEAENPGYGSAVDTDGARILASAVGEFPPDAGFPPPYDGVVVVHRLEGDAWVEETRLEGTGYLGLDVFGFDCAVDGDVALVSAPGICVGDCLPGIPPGEVVFFERGPAGWSEVLRTTSSEALESDAFGRAVDVDGDRAAVGAFDRVYVFERIDGVWTEVAFFQSGEGSGFGADLELEGDRLVVGAPPLEFAPFGATGAVHVIERIGGTWTEVAVIDQPTEPNDLEGFGRGVALSGDRIAVGAPRASYVDLPVDPDLVAAEPGVVDAGLVLVYERQPGGAWELRDHVGPVEPGGERFGREVALEGDRMLVGAPLASEAHLFERTSLGWAERAVLPIPDPDPGGLPAVELFGEAVALTADTLVVGAPEKDGDRSSQLGAAYARRVPLLTCETPRLLGVPTFVPSDDGGTHVLALDAGPDHAGDAYVVGGSLSGTEPGTPFGAVVVPLVFDAYSLVSLTSAGAGAFPGTFGFLDAEGRATGGIAVPPGLAVGALGVEAHHAAVVLGPAGAELVAGPARLRLLP